MCGINGIIQYNPGSKAALKMEIIKMNDIIYHRGPDDDGIFTEIGENYSLALGMRRLSIIDLESGQQPIFSDDRNLVIVFNGEIYNYPELRKDLLRKGVTFNTHSDTEVILKLYESEGVTSFNKLDGMFAFSIFDKRKKKVIVARDFFGEKPLYYTKQGNRFIWGSELKSLLKVMQEQPPLSMKGVNFFLRLTFIPAPYTIYEGIYKLEANKFIEIDLESNSFVIEQIENEFQINDEKLSFDQAKSKVRQLVIESVSSRSIADVPIGTFLSGGVDSSIVSLCLSKIQESPINTFSIGFEKKEWGETDKSQLVANLIGSKHHEFIIGEEDLKENIHEIILNFDEPFSDSASLPTYLVAKKTSEHLKVALTGDGGDEIFGGYSKYQVGKINSKYTALVPEKLHHWVNRNISPLLADKHDKRGRKFRIRKMLNSVSYDHSYYWDIISLANSENDLKDLLKAGHVAPELFEEYKDKLGIRNPKSLTEFRFVDKLLSLEGGMLPKVDRTSMLNSLECRAPFLNKKLWAFTNGLPEKFLINGWNKKYILKESFKEEFPEGFLNKSKQGFGSPVGDWLRSGLKNELLGYIEQDFLEQQDIFNITYVQNLVQQHLLGKIDNSFKVWNFYCFQKWYCHSYIKVPV